MSLNEADTCRVYVTPGLREVGWEPEDELEYYVRVEWIKTVLLEQAIKEKGFFGNQNSFAKPKARKWVHTIERLKQRLDVSD